MKDGVEILYSLQLHDDQIIDIENLIKEIPREIQKLEAERDGKASILESSKTKLNENIKKREKLEKEVLLVKEKINKYKDQMSKATTNKEYQGFIAEIKFEENNITGIEEKIIEHMLESDEIMAEIRSSEAELNKIVEDFNQKIQDMNSTLEYQDSKRKEKVGERTELRQKIPKNLLRIYDNLFAKKFGKAVAFVETDFCGACNVKIRPQRLNELIASSSLQACENCGRVLYKKVEVEKDDQE